MVQERPLGMCRQKVTDIYQNKATLLSNVYKQFKWGENKEETFMYSGTLRQVYVLI